MANIPDLLLETFQSLGEEDFKMLRWSLMNSVEGYKCLPRFKMEKADRLDTVDMMVQSYGHSGAVEITLTMLKKINQNQLAEELRTKHREQGAADTGSAQGAVRGRSTLLMGTTVVNMPSLGFDPATFWLQGQLPNRHTTIWKGADGWKEEAYKRPAASASIRLKPELGTFGDRSKEGAYNSPTTSESLGLVPELRKYVCDLTLDPNTVHRFLALSEKNRKVASVQKQQSYPNHPERFDVFKQVMCRQSLTGRCYWEAEWSCGAVIAVTYKGISRKGCTTDCGFGLNRNSWMLRCYSSGYSACNNNSHTVVPEAPSSSNRVGVYLDFQAGILSFYSVSSDTRTLTHLHTFHHTFTEPLYAGFGLQYYGSSVCVCQPK